MRVTEEFSNSYVQPILDDWDIPSGIGAGTGSVGAPIGGGYSIPSAPAYDTYQPSYGGKPPGALEDGLGHWWNEATQQWENDSGGAYQAPAAIQQPTEYLGNSQNSGVYQQGGNTWENGNWWNTNDEVWSNELNNWFKPQDLNQAWQDIAQHDNSFGAPDVTLPSSVLRDLAQHDNSFPAPDTMLPSQPWLQEHENAIPYDPWSGQAGQAWLDEMRKPRTVASPDIPWWEMDPEQARAPGDLRQPDPFNVGYKADARFPKGGTIGDPLDYLLNTFGRPVAETAFQAVSPYLQNYSFTQAGQQDKMAKDPYAGWQDLGNTVSQSGFNPNEFMDIQREKYAERPWYEKFAGDAIFDPLNLAGAGALKKVGLLDDAADLFKGVDRGVDLAELATGTKKGAKVIPGVLSEMPQFAPDIERGWQAADELSMGISGGKAYPQLRGAADDAFRAVDPEELAFGRGQRTAESAIRSGTGYGLKEGPTPEEAAATLRRSQGRVNPEKLSDEELDKAISAADRLAGKADNMADNFAADVNDTSDLANDAEFLAARDARNKAVSVFEDDHQRLLDEKRARELGLRQFVNSEVGSVPTELAIRLAGQTALGAGVGAAYGEASGGDWKKGALVGAGIGAGTAVGFKAAEKVASKGVAAKLQENIYPRPLAAQKLVAILKEAKPIRGAQEALYSAERSRRAGLYLGSLGSGSGAEARLAAAKGALGGELPRTKAFEEVRSSLNANDIDELFSHIEDTPLRGAGKNDAFTKTKATDALVKTLMGELPTHSDIKLLGQIFGEDFEKALLSKRSLGAKAWENMMEVAELPRTLLTSMDMSAPLRQGLIPGLVHPFEATKSFGKMLRAMASPEYSKLLEEGIRTSPNADMYEKMGLEFTSTGATLAHREETIASSLAGHIPLVGGSQRGYTTFMNQLRKGIADNFIASNPNLSDKEMKSFGRLINITSGRGVIPKSWEDKTALLTPFFAPKYAISRFQLPVEMLKALKAGVPGASDAASREAARQLFGFIGAGTAVLYLGKQSGLWDVELDPRSSDFGKGKIGPQRFDVWAGEQQLVRTAAQLITRQGKAQTGNIYDKPRRDTLEDWFRSKLGPPAALGYDLYKGEDINHNPVKFNTKEAIGDQAWNRLAPIFLQDIADAARVTGNPWRALSAAPAALGIGVSTYEDSDSKKRQDWIKANSDLLNDPNLVQEGKTPDSWDNLSPRGKELVNGQYGKIESTSEESVKAKAVLDAKIAEQGEDDAKLGTSMTPEQWWNAYADRKHDLFVAKDTIYSGLQASGKFGTDPILTPYFDAIEASKAGNGGRPDWDEVDKYTATLTPAQRDYIKTNTGLIKIDTPQVRAMEKIHDDIEASGYFERVDENWAKVSKTLGITGYDSYYDWRNAEIDRLLGKYGYDRSDVNTVAEINKYLDKQEPAKGMDYYRKQWNDKWVMENPEAAYHAWQLGFYNPIADIKRWLASKFEKPND